MQAYVSTPCADLRASPEKGRDRQLRYGDVFETSGAPQSGFVFGQSRNAGHEGWILQAALEPADSRPESTHWVMAQQTHAYSAPDFKSPERMALPHLARVCVSGEEGRFSQTEAGWIPTRHLTSEVAKDPVSVSELYLGVPYLWGGNSIWGIDCSGLVHAGLLACGVTCPSDSGPQEQRLGERLPEGTAPQRGDLLFWMGHVAWVADPDTLLHANAHHMAVAYEPINEAIRRIEEQGDGPVTAHKRLKEVT